VIPFIMPAVAAAQARTKMVVGYASMSSVATTLWVAQEKGFFAKNGIDVQTVFIPGSPTLIATINTGDVHLAYTGGTATLGAAVGGLDMKILAAFSNHVQNDFVVRPEIKTPGDVKGKRVGVTSIGGTGWMSALLTMEQIGLSPERDKILLAAFGDQRVISQALETGTIQGAALAGVFSQRLKRMGYNFLGDVEKIALVGTAVVVKADYLASHQALVRSALRALMEGQGYLLKFGRDQESHDHDPQPRPTPAARRRVVALDAKTGQIGFCHGEARSREGEEGRSYVSRGRTVKAIEVDLRKHRPCSQRIHDGPDHGAQSCLGTPWDKF